MPPASRPELRQAPQTVIPFSPVTLSGKLGLNPVKTHMKTIQHTLKKSLWRGKITQSVPEFRISELVETYIEGNEGDFLADINNIFNLTGASISDSSQENFFKTYTNSDFLKYFSVVDEDLNDQRSGNLKINRDKVSLTCKALLKFLPYKGFYPAERTLELATIFSQSYGSQVEVYNGSGAAVRNQSFRTLLEPLLSLY